MKFTVAKEHRDFFRKHQRIEFEGLLSTAQQVSLSREVNAILSKRMKISPADFGFLSSEQMFMAGRDVWRESAILKKIILHETLATLASELIEVKPLRIAYDQILTSKSQETTSDNAVIYEEWLLHPASLQEKSCIQGILSGLMLCIAEGNEADMYDEATLSQAPSIFPRKAGNGVFFSPEAPIDFSDLRNRPGFTYLMIVYTKGVSVYRKQEEDPHTHDLRSLGYNFGDRLSDRYHPLVYL